MNLKLLFNKQPLKKQEEALDEEKRVLKAAADPATLKAALLRLLLRHDMPRNAVKWPELHSLIHAANRMAVGVLPTSHGTIRASIALSFRQKQLQVRDILRSAKSPIHITTDTWHSLNSKELQAINAHFVGKSGRLRKALIGLAELESGHSGPKVAKNVPRALKWYGIEHRLGYVTGDNHGANDTLCAALAEELEDWDPVRNRLRCLGYIINLAVQAFLFAKDDEAVEEAERQSQRTGQDLDTSLQ